MDKETPLATCLSKSHSCTGLCILMTFLLSWRDSNWQKKKKKGENWLGLGQWLPSAIKIKWALLPLACKAWLHFSPLFSLICSDGNQLPHKKMPHESFTCKELREASGQHPTSTQVLGTIIYKTENPPNNHLSEFGLRPCDDHSSSWHLERCFWEILSQRSLPQCNWIPRTQKLWGI